MLNAIAPYVGFTAAGLVLVILAVDRHLQVRQARIIAIAARWPDADVTQRLPVIVLAPSTVLHVAPPLPPAAFRCQPAPPLSPALPPRPPAAHGLPCRQPDRPADPRREARLMTPWGDLARLPGSDEHGVVPSTLAMAGYLPAT